MSSSLEHRIPLHTTHWAASRKICFRCTFCYLFLYYGDSTLRWFPGMGFLLSWPETLWRFMMYGLAVALLHPSKTFDFAQSTGSGDRLIDYVGNAVCLLLTGVVVAIWSATDRQRNNYDFLEGLLRAFARYSLALTLLGYGMVKIVPTQFQHLSLSRLDETYGASSPMGLLWNFMAYSTGYTVFAGLMEVLPGMLLLFRRTAPLGALIAFSVLTNIVALNFFYDVPVKLFSLNLLFLSGYLLWPYAQPLWGLLVQNRPTAPLSEAKIRFKNAKIGRLVSIARVIFLMSIVLQCGIGGAERYRAFRQRSQQPHSPLTDRGFHWSQEEPFNR